MRILDKSGDIRDNERLVEVLHNTEHRLERRKRIIRDPGLRTRHDRQQRRLTRIRVTYETYVSDELELYKKILLFARHTEVSELRRLSYGIREMHISETALAAYADDLFLSVFSEIREDLACIGILDDRAYGDCDL